MFKTTRLALLAGFLAFAPLVTLAAPQVVASQAEAPAAASSVVATVNGAPLTQALINLEIQTAVQRGQTDSPNLAEQIKKDLIDAMVLSQEAKAEGLDKQDNYSTIESEVRDEILAHAVVTEYVKRNPITDDQIKTEYDREKAETLDEIKKNPDGKASQELSYVTARHIQVGTKEAALKVLDQLKKGKAFDELAQKLSTDKQTASKGGSWGEVLRTHFDTTPGIKDALDKLEPGQITQEPIQTNAGWDVVQLQDRRINFPSLDQRRSQVENYLKSTLVNAYITRLIAKYPLAKPTDKDIDGLLAAIKARGKAESPDLRTKLVDVMGKARALAAEAHALGLDNTPEVTLQQTVSSMYNLRNIMMQNYLKNNVISDDAVRADFERNKASMARHEIESRHILVATASEALAQKIYSTLKKHPEQFVELAKKHSIDPSSATKGGDLGWADPKGFIPEFANALTALKKGEISKPILSKYGWHIIQKEDEKDTMPSFEQVAPQLKQKAQRDAAEEYVAQLRAKAVIK